MSTMGTCCAASPRSATPGPLRWLLLAEKTARPSACCTGLAENGLASSGSPPLAIMTENQNVLGSTLEVLPPHFSGLRLVQAANGSSATQSLSPPLPVLAQSAPPGQALLMPHLLILPGCIKTVSWPLEHTFSLPSRTALSVLVTLLLKTTLRAPGYNSLLI